MTFSKLFGPLTVGNLTIKNRLVLPPMVVNLASARGECTGDTVAYYETRAKGGCGTVIVEASAVRADGRITPFEIGIDNDDLIPGLRDMAAAITRHGSAAVIQLNHSGRQGRSRVIQAQPVCPSPEPSPVVNEMPRELPTAEIRELVRCYAMAACRAKDAGFNAVEIHGAHGYLVHQFMSPLVNKRSDDYGGDFERRLRFPLEIVAAIRRQCGEHSPIFFRISANEHMEGGLTLADTTVIARRMEDAGVSVLDISAGTYGSSPMMTPSNSAPRGTHVPYAEAIKRVVSVPVIGVGRITDPCFAEAVLESGRADLIAVGRGMIADPEFASKAELGREKEIRKCIGCRTCAQAVMSDIGLGLLCPVNPAAGHEAYFIERTDSRKTVLVVGNGLAAMHVAMAATLLGHKVALWAGQGVLGGTLIDASGPSNLAARMIVKMLAAKLTRAGVRVLRDAADLDRLPPDRLIVEGGEAIPSTSLASVSRLDLSRYDEPQALLTALDQAVHLAISI